MPNLQRNPEPSAQPTVLILGANGRLGHAAAIAFAQAGWRVLAQTRRPLQPGLPASVERIDLPTTDTAALAARAAGARVVVHALNPHYTRWATELLPLARQGMDLAEALGATFMLPGNVYNYGAPMPARLLPSTPQQPSTRKGGLRCDLEQALQARVSAGRLRAVVLRAGDFYGGLVAGTWLDLVMAKGWRQGTLVYPGPLDVPHAWAYLPDLARAFVAVAERLPTAPYSTLHFEGHTLTGAQALAAMQTAAGQLGGVPARGWQQKGFPFWPVMAAFGWAVPIWRELSEMRYLWTCAHQLEGSALQAAVGPLPGTPVVEAMARALDGIGSAKLAEAVPLRSA